jgi:hypothetical protein
MDDRLRLLARWQARRREVDELLAPLLAHGPAAVDRVGHRLADVQLAMAAEQDAYAAFCAEVGSDHAITLDSSPVDELAQARRRALRVRHAALVRQRSYDLPGDLLEVPPLLEVVDAAPAPRPAPDQD